MSNTTLNVWQIAEFFHTGGNIGVSVNNGVAVTAASGNQTDMAAGTLLIGKHRDGEFFSGDWGCMLAYNRILTAPEKAQVHAYIRSIFTMIP